MYHRFNKDYKQPGSVSFEKFLIKKYIIFRNWISKNKKPFFKWEWYKFNLIFSFSWASKFCFISCISIVYRGDFSPLSPPPYRSTIDVDSGARV